MSDRILIKIPCFNRKAIAEQCIPTVVAGMASGKDYLTCYNDGSTEYNGWHMCADHAVNCENMGIERQRRLHFENFMHAEKGFTHLYLTDLDAIHDPAWRSKALALQRLANGAPVCLYNTMAHENLVGNTIQVDMDREIVWRKFAPGVSYLLTRGHVETICNAIKDLPDPLHWDWTVPAILGYRMAISRISYVDHIGLGGLHHGAADIEGGDRATNPTWWLVKKREQIIQRLTNATPNNNDLNRPTEAQPGLGI